MFARTTRATPALLLLSLLACGADEGSGPDPDPDPDPVPPVATSLEIAPDTATLTAIGDTVRLEAEVRDQDGEVMTDAAVTWSSLDAGVATVSGTGLATAAAEGAARIVAAAGETADTAVLTVEQMPAALEVSPDSATLVPGDTLRLTAAVTDSNGVAVEGAAVTWSSADEAVVVVDSAGRVDALSEGVARVTAKAGPAADTATITVGPEPEPEPSTIEVSPGTVTFSAVGDSVQLSAVVRDANGHEVEGAEAEWSSADAVVATVSEGGWVVARGNGTTVIEARSGELADTAVAVVAQVAAELGVSPAEATLAQGDTVRLTAAATDSNGVAIESAAVTWSSADEAVATVDGTGLVTAVRGGETQLTASAGAASGAATIAVLDRLLFQSDRDGNSEIYVMNADGSGQVNVSRDPAPDEDPVWSPDGSRIAFVSRRDGNSEIYVVNADGSGLANLSNSEAFDGNPAWSPDGTKIAFESTRGGGNVEIYVMSADGTNPVNLTRSGGVNDHSPAWSPDGTKIAFSSHPNGNYDIFVMNAADGSDKTNLTNDAGGNYEPIWSPDGTKILFVSQRDGNDEIYVVNADGTGRANLTQDPGFDGEAAWSPDGLRLAFTSLRDGTARIYLLLAADGSGLTRLTQDLSGSSRPAWSPDGMRIAFQTGRDGDPEVYVMNVDGSGLINLTNRAGFDGSPAWQPRP
ncbi:MAG TPA: Ig-like domain-containing protein [Longimicrobiales bacterium]